MSERTRLMTAGLHCDGPRCAAAITGPELPSLSGRDHYEHRADAEGWSIWVGHGRRHYCPDCAPAPGHKMRPAHPGGGYRHYRDSKENR
ncbi:hypothetical protein [Saccharopolyspora sp. 6V]|uniref:hypothetical protein n=1 Tax=Saccharopolyspora sp. 6V TaxID=2877239 RepID=UPI001CD1C78E|nr:hypothetical protein [Saccharopolyspora sp. 6V]MCA1194163.1 hypothetical protein [Saccharopolyspora sp. 6V]